jgi:hypothetical protein
MFFIPIVNLCKKLTSFLFTLITTEFFGLDAIKEYLQGKSLLNRGYQSAYELFRSILSNV